MPGKLVNFGSTLKCSMGATPASLLVAVPVATAEEAPAANIMDFEPLVNIPPFGMCKSPANPTVAAATAAALGVLTPMPCVPATAPWTPGVPTVLLRGQPALDAASKCLCCYGGEITVETTDATVAAG